VEYTRPGAGRARVHNPQQVAKPCGVPEAALPSSSSWPPDDSAPVAGDLKPGMILESVVTNIAAFGALVDVGVHQDGLVHISAMANAYVKDPARSRSLAMSSVSKYWRSTQNADEFR
jgi:hypothetical protein